MPYAQMICDPYYGKNAIDYASAHGVRIIVAIEKSGVLLTEWLSEESAYEIILARPPSWGVKLLWQFADGMPADQSRHQLTKLKELARVCEKLDRKLMLELIMPRDFAGDDAVIKTVARIYREGVFPYWWKLACMHSREAFISLARTIDEYDAYARILILGGETKELGQFSQDFAIAQSTHHGIGFAIGRSIFWPSFCGYLNGDMTLVDVKTDVAQRFGDLFDLWLAH
jgi:myo-inositol catabolism protein IolC